MVNLISGFGMSKRFKGPPHSEHWSSDGSAILLHGAQVKKTTLGAASHMVLDAAPELVFASPSFGAVSTLGTALSIGSSPSSPDHGTPSRSSSSLLDVPTFT